MEPERDEGTRAVRSGARPRPPCSHSGAMELQARARLLRAPSGSRHEGEGRRGRGDGRRRLPLRDRADLFIAAGALAAGHAAHTRSPRIAVEGILRRALCQAAALPPLTAEVTPRG